MTNKHIGNKGDAGKKGRKITCSQFEAKLNEINWKLNELLANQRLIMPDPMFRLEGFEDCENLFDVVNRSLFIRPALAFQYENEAVRHCRIEYRSKQWIGRCPKASSLLAALESCQTLWNYLAQTCEHRNQLQELLNRWQSNGRPEINWQDEAFQTPAETYHKFLIRLLS